MANLATTLRAFQSRNYRLFFSGQGVSLIGTWMTRLAMSWLVYRLTGSAVLLGITGFTSQIPAFILGPIVGVWLDRWNRHRVIVILQTVSMLQSFALAALALSGVITVWEIIALSLLQGIVNAFEIPARQSFVVQMVEKREDLANAIAINASMVNAARLVGPAIAGMLVATVGEGYCFLIDGISYIGVIVGLLMMDITRRQPQNPRRHPMHELAEGWRYVIGSAAIRSLLINLGLVSLFAMPYSVLLPIFAKEVLHGNANTLGFLSAASGVGALVGTVTLAMRTSVVGLLRVISVATALCGIALVFFGMSTNLWLSLLLMALLGFGMMQQMAPSNTVLQTVVDDEKRGRVMAFYSMAFQGMAPFGSLFAGNLAAHIGAPKTVVISGLGCMVASLLFTRNLKAMRDVVRPIYRKMGILPEETGA